MGWRKIQRKINRSFEKIEKELDKVLERVLYRLYRAIARNDMPTMVFYATLDTVLKQELMNSGLGDVVQVWGGFLNELEIEVTDYLKQVAERFAGISDITLSLHRLELVKHAAIDRVAQLSDEFARRLKTDLASIVLASEDPRQVLKRYEEVIESRGRRYFNYIKTELSTALANYNSFIVDDFRRQTNWKCFKYMGPLDRATRPFCRRLVGRVLTYSQIMKLDNGQLPNVFITRGGYNCRHFWVPVKCPERR